MKSEKTSVKTIVGNSANPKRTTREFPQAKIGKIILIFIHKFSTGFHEKIHKLTVG